MKLSRTAYRILHLRDYGVRYKGLKYIKRRNLWKGFRDQLPMSVLLKSTLRGELKKLLSRLLGTRSHFNADETPKRRYKSREYADKKAEAMSRRTTSPLSAYQCVYCPYYHIGNDKDKKT